MYSLCLKSLAPPLVVMFTAKMASDNQNFAKSHVTQELNGNAAALKLGNIRPQARGKKGEEGGRRKRRKRKGKREKGRKKGGWYNDLVSYHAVSCVVRSRNSRSKLFENVVKINRVSNRGG